MVTRLPRPALRSLSSPVPSSARRHAWSTSLRFLRICIVEPTFTSSRELIGNSSRSGFSGSGCSYSSSSCSSSWMPATGFFLTFGLAFALPCKCIMRSRSACSRRSLWEALAGFASPPRVFAYFASSAALSSAVFAASRSSFRRRRSLMSSASLCMASASSLAILAASSSASAFSSARFFLRSAFSFFRASSAALASSSMLAVRFPCWTALSFLRLLPPASGVVASGAGSSPSGFASSSPLVSSSFSLSVAR
mmetsp:Transcript_64770/g.166681  ORF Transcript_64770/g.166681 Transcript_64770/m.166681 type:complete len:252 (+) Transcript_64770:293-1048(+)